MQDPNLRSIGLSEMTEAICQMDPEIADFLRFLMTRSGVSGREQACGKVAKSVFERPSPQDFDELSRVLHKPADNPLTQAGTVFDGHLPCQGFIPMRHFRSDTARLWEAVEKLRIFLSSGTTSGLERRSRSVFSQKGLLFYKAGSIAAFLSGLQSRVPPFSANFLNSPVFSLIPPVSKWPDSSLAQMIEWFSQYWKTTYLDDENLITSFRLLADSAQSDHPVIVWGTAFHFVNLLDDESFRVKLPPGSIVIETGGTKGKARSVTRQELYQMICRGFGIRPSDILSEYGMCELSSQAWDVAASKQIYLEDRKFQFPWWVSVGVMSKPFSADKTGVGALTIYDPLRIDLPGRAIQTEDMACLSDDGFFSLQGRVPTAPLKGCSLNVENLKTDTPFVPKTKSKPVKDFYAVNEKEISLRAPKVRRWLLELLADSDAHERLKREFGDSKIAQKTITDLSAGLPIDAQGFVAAAQNSIAGSQAAKNWLMIPPSSHSVALIYPLTCALTLGFSIRVRLTDIHGIPADETFLARAIALANVHGFQVSTLPHSWRLGSEDLLDQESVLVFGDDDTAQFIRHFSGERASIFGNAISVTIVTDDDFDDSLSLSQLIEDQFSLGQRGCLSSRAVISLGGNQAGLKEKLLQKNILQSRDETVAAKTARSMDVARLSELDFEILDNFKGLTVAIKNVSIPTLSNDAESAISRIDFVMPILLVPEITDKKAIIEGLLKISSLEALSLSSRASEALSKTETYSNLAKHVRLVRLGTLGAPSLDGHHLGRPFFAT